ncbi:hypothetical protein MKY84_02550 [Chryseomicrobium sp. FSL W7-1435]|uniref:hypothetical protein n=1 Tax=Chryseomicrobium sp. FSL W7-1435 TaxID=2921704 RepID=UPI00315AD084
MEKMGFFIQNFIEVLMDQAAIVAPDGTILYTNPEWDLYHLNQVETAPLFTGENIFTLRTSSQVEQLSEGLVDLKQRTTDEVKIKLDSAHQLVARRCLLDFDKEGFILFNRELTSYVN